MSKRIDFIDGLRGLCMMLIIFIHILPADISSFGNAFFNWTNLFKIALFYMVSGYLFFMKPGRDSKQLFQSLLRTLGIPYLFFSFLFMLFDLKLSNFWSKSNIMAIVIRDGINTLTLRGIGTLWFLPTIFFTIILANFLFKNMKYFKISVFLSLFLFIGLSYVYSKMSISHLVVSNLILVIGKTCFAYFNFTIIYFINPIFMKKDLKKYIVPE